MREPTPINSPIPTQPLQIIVLQLVRRSMAQLPSRTNDFEGWVGMRVRGAAQTGVALIVQLTIRDVEVFEKLHIQPAD